MPEAGERRRAKKACYQCRSRAEVFHQPKGHKRGFWQCENDCGPETLAKMLSI